MSQTQLFAVILNFSFILVIGVVGWLLRRAITAQDTTLQELGRKLEQNNTAIASLQLLIVGDYFPRKEHVAFAEHINHVIDQLRANIHNLRNEIQTVVNKQTVIETKLERAEEDRGHK